MKRHVGLLCLLVLIVAVLATSTAKKHKKHPFKENELKSSDISEEVSRTKRGCYYCNTCVSWGCGGWWSWCWRGFNYCGCGSIYYHYCTTWYTWRRSQGDDFQIPTEVPNDPNDPLNTMEPPLADSSRGTRGGYVLGPLLPRPAPPSYPSPPIYPSRPIYRNAPIAPSYPWPSSGYF